MYLNIYSEMHRTKSNDGMLWGNLIVSHFQNLLINQNLKVESRVQQPEACGPLLAHHNTIDGTLIKKTNKKRPQNFCLSFYFKFKISFCGNMLFMVAAAS